MQGQKINFYYYSGTGNTFLVMKEMVKVFSSDGIKVDIHRIEETAASDIDTNSVVGLAFPVAYQSTFPFLWKFFRNMPDTSGTPVFMVDTMMSFSGAIVGPLKKVLKSKGYNCIGAKEIVMPSNWFPKKINPAKNDDKIRRGLEKAGQYAHSLIDGKTSWSRIPFLSKGFYYLCCNNFLMNNVNVSPGRKITINKEKCRKCGLCEKLCPRNNITMNEYPEWDNNCEVCMRCLNFCPAEAVYIPDKNFIRYRSVKANDLLKNNFL